MKIAIDGRALTVIRTGGGYYTYHLLRKLKDSDNQFLICAHKPLMFGVSSGNIDVRIDRFPLGVLWQHIGLPHTLKKEAVDLLHSPLFTLPLYLPCPAIITILDLTPILFPELHHWKVRLSLRYTMQSSAQRAKKIIAISRSTCRDIVENLNVSEDRIVVIYPGVDTSFHPRDSEVQEKIRQKYTKGGKFILNVGTLEPRKNLSFLIDVYNTLMKKFREPLHLVLAGGKGWNYKHIFGKVSELGIEDKVLFTGYVPQDELSHLYNAAEVFVFPSLYEGFGLPLVEAMASGVPVVASSTSSIPEVVGIAGGIIDGWDVEEWADCIYGVLVDGKKREDMKNRGIEQAKKFSWERCAKETLKLYKEVVGE